MLGRFGSMLEGKNNPERESLSVEGYSGSLFGTMSGQCWAVLGLCWAHVGSFGRLYGPWRSLGWGGKPSTENFSVEGFLGGNFLPSRDFLEPYSCHI